MLAARKANFLSLLVLAKKSQCSACSRMLAKNIRHPLDERCIGRKPYLRAVKMALHISENVVLESVFTVQYHHKKIALVERPIIRPY